MCKNFKSDNIESYDLIWGKEMRSTLRENLAMSLKEYRERLVSFYAALRISTENPMKAINDPSCLEDASSFEFFRRLPVNHTAMSEEVISVLPL